MGMSDATSTSKTQTKNVNCLYMLLDGGLYIKCMSSRDICPLLVSDDLVVRVALRSIRAVERGLSELRKLGIEQQLWEASRKGIDQPSSLAVANHKPATDSDASS